MGIGIYLKEKRTDKGLTLENVEKELKIKAALLDAAEKDDTNYFISLDNYEDITECYCAFLGLNKQALAAQDRVLRIREQRGIALEQSQAKTKEAVASVPVAAQPQPPQMRQPAPPPPSSSFHDTIEIESVSIESGMEEDHSVDMNDLLPALKIMKERQRVSVDMLEIHLGSYEKAKKVFAYLEANSFIAKPKGAYDWILNNEKINEYLKGAH